jgi:hypothetical protein
MLDQSLHLFIEINTYMKQNFMLLSIILTLKIVIEFSNKNYLNLFLINQQIYYIMLNLLKINNFEPLKSLMKTLVINIVMYLILIDLRSLFFGNSLV